uniref:Uncharacterized protein n=1 Tax=Aegilops tauschii subsp. strangulata TaxID=200361 RepID=A0A453HE84_AEGTS
EKTRGGTEADMCWYNGAVTLLGRHSKYILLASGSVCVSYRNSLQDMDVIRISPPVCISWSQTKHWKLPFRRKVQTSQVMCSS